MNDAESFEVTITYLQQLARPVLPSLARPPGKLALLRAENPPVHFYRYLFDRVGGPWRWVSRRYMGDEELAAIIQDREVYLYVLYLDGVPCGMGEIDARGPADDGIEIKFFGLMEEFTGRRIGKWFLGQMIELAWSFAPKKVRIETCTADHPAALPLYQRMGFEVCGQGTGTITWKG